MRALTGHAATRALFARRIAVITALLALALVLPHVRRQLITDIVTWDAPAGDPANLPSGTGPGLPAVPRVRVVLIDGLAADTARTLPAWSALCHRGVTLLVDVGFPTISLPVEVALWTGLTQQQTGVVFRSDRPLVPPIDLHGIPAQLAQSTAIAESHGYIVRSLGFANVEPAADPADPARDVADPAWAETWQTRAREAVGGSARLVFVHVLRVDVAGHQHGHASVEYRQVAAEADAILASLVAANPDARWFVLSDHGHLATGGHGGEERDVRQVEGCIAGPGITAAGRGQLVHVVDVARAIADSTGVQLDPASRGRPLSVALASPLEPDQAVPALALEPGVIAIFLLVFGAGLASWGVRRWWLAPWWFVLGCGALWLVRGEPTLSMPMVYRPEGRDMYLTWLPALAVATVTAWFGLGRTTLARVLAAQLALPFAAAAAALAACGAWPAVFGAEIAPIVPRYTAWCSPLLLIAAHGAAAVALAVAGRTVHSAFGRRGPPETPSTATASG